MLFLKISSIFFQAVYILIFCNSSSTLRTFRLQDIEIKEYYLSSSQIYGLENNWRIQKRETMESEFIFTIKFDKNIKPLKALIKKRKSDVVLENTKIFHLFSNENGNRSSIEEYNKEDVNLYEGYILENPHNSSINGYIKENCFYGHAIINNTFYYIDEFKHLKDSLNIDTPEIIQQKRNAIIYLKKSVIFKGFSDASIKKMILKQLGPKDFLVTFQSWKSKGMLCALVIVIDYSYLTFIHGGNLDAAKFQVLFSLEEANSMFRSTDFDGDGVPDNIGFYVRKLVVLATNENPYFIPEYMADAVSVTDFIAIFKRYDELPLHCLGIVFTAQQFKLKTLGASFSADNQNFQAAGGICESLVLGVGTHNALVITVVTEKYRPVPQTILEITIAHELGHSFGSSHDEETNGKCFGYIMSPKTFADLRNITHMLFSPCSKEQMIRTLVVKGNCFEPVKTSFCGNGIVEDDEHCDCGLTRECLEKDPCCVPRRTKEYPCRVNKKAGFECHPSQGECCTTKCKYSIHLEKYVNCKNFDRACPCQKPKRTCSCGINGMCIQNNCHSVECTRLSLSECHCQEDKGRKKCSVCCVYNNKCMPVLEATEKIIIKEKNEKIFTELTNIKNSNNPGKNSVAKIFCLKTRYNRCVNLNFLQADVNDYCLLNGKLGKCNASFFCKILPNKRSFPALENNGGRRLAKFKEAEHVFYLLMLIFKIYV